MGMWRRVCPRSLSSMLEISPMLNFFLNLLSWVTVSLNAGQRWTESGRKPERDGVPVSPGAPATTVEEALAAADEIGYPVVVKAQVLIGGRGKAGGIKLAADRDEARAHAEAILGMDIRGHTVHELWIEKASD